MLNKFKAKDKRRILIILSLIIVPSFALFGSIAYLREKNSEVFVYIGNKRITYTDFNNYYIPMARDLNICGLDTLPIEDKTDKKLVINALINKGLEYILFLWKAEKEKIKVTDNELIEKISNLEVFSSDGKFNQKQYLRFLKYIGTEPKTFEEYVSNYIKIKKLLEKYIKIDITDKDIKEAYLKDTQKAKISYIYLPYEKFKVDFKLSDKEIEDFYKENKYLFKEDAKAKIQYVIINNDNPKKDKILKDLNNLKDIKDLSNNFDLEVKEIEISLKDPIPEVGWQEKINKSIFLEEKNKISSPIEINNGYFIFEKKEQRQEFIPPFDLVKDKVYEKIKEEKAKKNAEEFSKNLFDEIKKNKIMDLEGFAKDKNLDFKTTDYFKYYDYIEGVGLDEKVSKAIFSLNKDQILEPLLLEKGAYIIQLKDISEFDEKDFNTVKEKYLNSLKTQKESLEKLKLIFNIQEESNFRIVNPQQ